MNIRKALPSDIDDIMKVECSSFIKEIHEEKSVFIERIKRCPDLFLIFEENGEVAGYLSAEILNSIPKTSEELKLGHLPSVSKNNDNSNSYIYISSFALLPSFRGGGKGKQMWNRSVNYFSESLNISHFLLLVNEEWKGAYHIYESSGFKTINTFPSFFFSNEKGSSSGILMEK